MARIRVDTDGISDIHTIMDWQTQTLQNVEQLVGQVLTSLDMKIAAAEDIQQSLISLKSSSAKQRTTLSDMSDFLLRVNDEFISSDRKISEQARDVNYLTEKVFRAAAIGTILDQRDRLPIRIIASRDIMERLLAGIASPVAMASPVDPLDLLLIAYREAKETIGPYTAKMKKEIGAYADVGKITKRGNEIFEWLDYLFSTDQFEDISDAFDEIGKKFGFQVAGYLKDAATAVDILFGDGDINDVPDLVGKYSKKIVKGVIKLKSGFAISGVANGVYLDIAWHFGENVNESIQTIQKDPSIATVLCGAWHVTGGAVIDTGVDLAEDLMSAAGVIGERFFGGTGFDSSDFHDAMDYLWGFPSGDKRTAAGDIINVTVAVGEAVVDSAVDAGKTIIDGAAAAGKAAGKAVANGFAAAGGYIKEASWLKWLP